MGVKACQHDEAKASAGVDTVFFHNFKAFLLDRDCCKGILGQRDIGLFE